MKRRIFNIILAIIAIPLGSGIFYLLQFFKITDLMTAFSVLLLFIILEVYALVSLIPVEEELGDLI